MAVLSLAVIYVVGINVFLSTSLFGKAINGDPETVFITFERGWSIVPGRVHARNLTIRSRDSKVEWILHIDKCDFQVSFLDLALKKKFHASDVHGAGVTFDGRQRVAAPALTLEYADALPIIPGLPRLPIRRLEAPDQAEIWDDAHWHLWTVELEGVVAEDVRRIWVDAMRFEGSARIAGDFYLKPIRDVRIGPIHADVRSGRTTVMQREILDAVAGSVDLRVKPFDPRVTEGVALLHLLSASTDVTGHMPDLANLSSPSRLPAKLTGPVDIRRLAVRIVDGKVTSDSHVDVGSPAASIEVGQHVLKATLAVVADVPPAPAPPRLTFRVDARGVTAARAVPGSEAPLFDAETLDVTGDAMDLDLADPVGDLHAVLVIPRGDMPDARSLDYYVPADTAFGVEGGRAHARVRLETWLADRRAKGELGLSADDMDLRVAKTRLAGGTMIDASFESWLWEANLLEGVKAKVHVAEGSIAAQAKPKTPLVDVRGFDIGIDAPAIDLADPLRAFHAKLDMPNSEIVDRGLLRSYLPRGHKMELARGHARFGLACEVDVKDHRGAGTVAAHARQLGFVLGDLSLFADLKASARVHDWDWEHGDLALDTARADLTRLTSKGASSRGAPLEVAAMVVEARSARFAFSDPLARLDLTATIAGGKVRDAVALNAFLPEGADVVLDTDGAGATVDAELRASVDAHVARGKVSARGHGLGVRGTKLRLRGDVDLTADIDRWKLDEDRLRVRTSRVTVDHVAARLGPVEVAKEGAGGQADEGAPDLTANRVELHAAAEEMDLAHPSLRGVDYRLTVDDARMDDATRLGALLSPKEAIAFAVESGSARGSADITVTPTQGTASGGVKIALGNAGIRFHETHLAGDFDVQANVRGVDAAADMVDISGSRIAMRNVRSSGADAKSSAWNGDIDLLQGGIRVSDAPAFDGFVQLHADDANPILAMVLGKSLPKLLIGMMKAPELSGQARLTVQPGRTAILDAHVRGGDVVARGDYVVRTSEVRGMVVVAKGPLSAGVKVDNNGTYLRLFNLESWRSEEHRAIAALFGGRDAGAEATAKAEADVKSDAQAKAAAAKAME